MNRRQLFLSTAKAALAAAFGGPWLRRKAMAQTAAAAAGRLPPGARRWHGVPAHPTRTRTIPGDVLPPPDLPFGGTINLNATAIHARGGRRRSCRRRARPTCC